MLLAPAAMAQEDTAATNGGTAGTTGVGTGQPPGDQLVDSGGVSIVLPAAALLLGSGVLAYAVVRRR
jgi:hypothetical protein